MEQNFDETVHKYRQRLLDDAEDQPMKSTDVFTSVNRLSDLPWDLLDAKEPRLRGLIKRILLWPVYTALRRYARQ